MAVEMPEILVDLTTWLVEHGAHLESDENAMDGTPQAVFRRGRTLVRFWCDRGVNWLVSLGVIFPDDNRVYQSPLIWAAHLDGARGETLADPFDPASPDGFRVAFSLERVVDTVKRRLGEIESLAESTNPVTLRAELRAINRDRMDENARRRREGRATLKAT